MKIVIVIPLLVAMSRSMGGESSLTMTFQPLDGLGSGTIVISPVMCHDWYSHSGQPTAIGLISAPNIPPTNNPEAAIENLNLASVCGVRFHYGDIGTTGEITIDTIGFSVPKRFDHPREQIVRACLECLRRSLPKKLLDAPVSLKASESDKIWLSEIIRDFNAHDRKQVFFIPPS